MKLEGLDHVALFVRDVHASAASYRDVLGLRRAYEEAWGDLPVVLVAGGSGVALFPAREAEPAPARRAPRHFAHVAFRTSGAGLREAREELGARGVALEEQDHGVSRSIYVRDPDGHEVEVTTYDLAGDA